MKDSTDITIVLDRSGSMQSIKDDVIGGFNNLLTDQQKAGDNATLTLVQFDTVSVDIVHSAVPIKDVQPLNGTTFQPRGGTPLLDAVGTSIVRAGERLSAMDEAERPDKVVFVILTDGYENASKEYSKPRIKEMIQRQQDTYKWQFIFLGANQDAFAEAHAMGISLANAAAFAATPDCAQASYSATSGNLRSYRSTGNAQALAFSDEQRKKLKDSTRFPK